MRLTKTGHPDEVYNGVPDWVYEEEVFEDNGAVWWNKNGEKLLYGVFDDSKVESVEMPVFGPWHGPDFRQYPGKDTVKYPKEGQLLVFV